MNLIWFRCMEILKAIQELKDEMNSNFRSVNERLDGIEYELKNIKDSMIIIGLPKMPTSNPSPND